MAQADYIIVGSGINALVCAALLGRKGRRVIVLERNDRIGGCIRSEAVTAPGFLHDVMATTFVLFITSPAFAALGADLARHGLAFANADLPTGVLLPDGRHAVLSRTRAANVAAFDALAPGDGAAFERSMAALGRNAGLVFGLLGGQLWSPATLRLLLGEWRTRGARGLKQFFGEALVSGRAHLEGTYTSEVLRGLFAPWVLHCGLNPESPTAGEMIKVIGFALEAAGAPIVEGGAVRLLQAFEGLLKAQGTAIRLGADVERIRRNRFGSAIGVTLADGTRLDATAGIICSLAPGQLYQRLLADMTPSAEIAAGLADFRHGKGNLQIHYALSAPAEWAGSPALSKVALLHLTPGLDGVSRAANECERGLLPAEPTLCVGQPTALDPSRAPPGQAVLWLQLPEAPRVIKGDALGEIETSADGAWTPAIREAYADRIEGILARHDPGFRAKILARKTYSPADLAALNVNLVGGDPYGGFCGLDQFFLWRPFKTSLNHRTPVTRLYHIGASTHPGPGLGGGSGFLLAQSLR
jgi:phytoene dehydrogenase-like protein